MINIDEMTRQDHAAMVLVGSILPSVDSIIRAGDILQRSKRYWGERPDANMDVVSADVLRLDESDRTHPDAVIHAFLVLEHAVEICGSDGMSMVLINGLKFPTNHTDLMEVFGVVMKAMNVIYNLRDYMDSGCDHSEGGEKSRRICRLCVTYNGSTEPARAAA